MAGLGSALGGLCVFLAVAVTGWFLADGGAHGNTKDALRVGADAWLVGHGSHLSFGGVDYTLVPLGLTALLAWAAFRGGSWAGRVSPPARDRELAQAVALLCSAYVVVAVVTSVLATSTEIRCDLVRTVVGALAMALVAGGAGLLSGAQRWPALGGVLPGWVWPLARTALAAVLALLLSSAVLVAAPLVRSLGASASLVSRLGLTGGDAVMLVVVTAVVAPNAVLLGTSYALGPGFAVGVGTSVSAGGVVLGPVPAFPLLSALPDAGATPGWTTALLALPPLAAVLGVVLVQRRHPVYAWDLGAVRGLGAGLLAGVGSGLLAALGGGALGDGRMADIGTRTLPAVGAGALSMGVAGLLAGLAMTALQRRGLLADEAADPAEEPTVEVVRQYRADRPPPPASAREREATDLLHRFVRSADDDEDTIRFL